MCTRLRLFEISRRRLRLIEVLLMRRKDSSNIRACELALANNANGRRIEGLHRVRRRRLINSNLTRHSERLRLNFLRLLKIRSTLRTRSIYLNVERLSASNSLTESEDSSASARNDRTRNSVVLRILSLKSTRALNELGLMRDSNEARNNASNLSLCTRITRRLSSSILINLLLLFISERLLVIMFLRRIRDEMLMSYRQFLQVSEHVRRLNVTCNITNDLLLSNDRESVRSSVDQDNDNYDRLLTLSFYTLYSRFALLLGRTQDYRILINVDLLTIVNYNYVRIS